MDVPDRIVQPGGLVLPAKGAEEGEILVHRLRDDVEIEPLGRARLLEHEERQALGRA
jgi:hypothetical protein